MAAASPAPAQEAALEAMALQLDVSINGSRRASIAAFTLDFAQRVASTRGELLELGIRSPGEGAPEDVVYLDSIPGLVYAYDEAAQAIDIRLGDDHRVTQVYGGNANEFVLPELGTGFFTNYSLYASGSGSSGSADDGNVFDGGSLALDSHFYSGFGTLTQSDVIGYTPDGDSAYTRLDTTYTYTNVPAMWTASAGDFVTGGLNWTRPIRMGGAQWRRDFDTRPDLVTMPLPSFQGSAAVPSTVDVFINNVKTRSYDVAEGPFNLDSVPIVSGSGTARIVVRDAQGRETVTERPIYASAELLSPGLVDFSIEAGFARLNQGTEFLRL